MKRIYGHLLCIIAVSAPSLFAAVSVKPLETALTAIDNAHANQNTAVTKESVADMRTKLKSARKEVDITVAQAEKQLDELDKRAKKGGTSAAPTNKYSIIASIEEVAGEIEYWYEDADARVDQKTADTLLQSIKDLEKAYAQIPKPEQNKKYTGMMESAKEQLKEILKRSEKDIQLKSQAELLPKIKTFSTKVEKWYADKTKVIQDTELEDAQTELKALQKEYDALDKKAKDKQYATMLETASTQLKEIGKRGALVAQKKDLVQLHKKIDMLAIKISGWHKNSKTIVDKKSLDTASSELKTLEKEYDKIDKAIKDKTYTDKLATGQKQLKEIEKRTKK